MRQTVRSELAPRFAPRAVVVRRAATSRGSCLANRAAPAEPVSITTSVGCFTSAGSSIWMAKRSRARGRPQARRRAPLELRDRDM